MKKLKKQAFTIFTILIFIVGFIVIGRFLHFGTYSTKEINPDWIEIRREKYPFRSWNYSGIFPAGQFIDDPHISSMSFFPWDKAFFEFDDEIKTALGDQKARYQAYDINVWFGKRYHEIILAVENKGEVFEYKIEGNDIEDGFVNNFDKYIPSFLWDNKLVFFSKLDISKPRFFVINLPLKHNQVIPTIKIESEQGEEILDYLLKTKKYKRFKQFLCVDSKSKINIKFYELFEKC